MLIASAQAHIDEANDMVFACNDDNAGLAYEAAINGQYKSIISLIMLTTEQILHLLIPL